MLINDLEHLPNIIGDIVADEKSTVFFSENDKCDIFETCLHLAEEYILSNPTAISDPDFIENIFDDIEDSAEELFIKDGILLNDIFFNADEEAQEEFDNIINDALNYYLDFFMPSRTQVTNDTPEITIIHCKDLSQDLSQNLSQDLSQNLSQITFQSKDLIAKKIAYLESKPQPIQRTPEWYTFRHNLITASNAYKAFESQSSKNQLIYEKCTPIKFGEDKKQRVNVESPLHWGQKYEPISVLYYENKYSTTVQDFGCIQHDTYDFLGASPDGINVDPLTSYYGRMLEIKNPVSREITGVPKKEYWIQMQLQMETCDLDECDFLETKFTEYENEQAFNADGIFLNSEKGYLKGVMLYFSDQDNCPKYVYKPLTMNEEEFAKWEQETIELYEGEKNMVWIKNNYWKLEQVSCILVLRNKQWFGTNIQAIEDLWKIVLEERVTGFSHRAPKQRPAKQSTIQVNKITNYINPFILTKIDINTDVNVNADTNTNTNTNTNADTNQKIKLSSSSFSSSSFPSGCLLNLKTDKITGVVTVVKKE